MAAGLGVTVVGKSVAQNNRRDVRFVPVDDLHTQSKVIAIRKEGRVPPLVEQLLDKIHAFLHPG